jgi:cellulose synthase (UDP-forming)
MTVTEIWQDIGAGENFPTKILRLLFVLAALATFGFMAALPLTWPQQTVLAVLCIFMGLAMARGSDSYLVTLTLMILSIFCTVRYGYWRIAQIVNFYRDPASHPGALDGLFIFALLGAEFYSFVILILGYFQTIWPLRRAPVELPDNPDQWPHIDVLIPTYNEPLEVVRYTALGALNIDWPAEKLHVYILDDGRRKEFEQFAFHAGIGYRTRPDNSHAKAGNINAALKTTDSPLIAIFDSDHVPTRSFLQMTVGWFLRDPRLAVLQTPHHFYSPDPFERNLEQFRIIPNEGDLFYGVVQDGNDFWNAAFFCGSCAVLRREALGEIGGIAAETVTEDAHTALRLQMKKWNTAYINIPQAAGLATERLSAHVGQRIRWARGMIQILRIDNPLFAPGLNFAQRLCYFNAMSHFLYAVPRLIFLTAPLIYLLFNHTNIPGYWAAILAYSLPHLTLSNVTNSRIQGDHRHSFWNEIYETVLSPYILLPTVMALINPRLGKFNVTAKGGVVKRTFFDSRIAQPFLVLLVFNFAGLLVAIPRFLVWDHERPGTVLMNVVWCLFNIVILGVCTAVARELRQIRAAVRVKVACPLVVKLPDGRSVAAETIDISSGGAGIRLHESFSLTSQTAVFLAFPNPSAAIDLRAKVVSSEGSLLRVRFENLSIEEHEMLTIALYWRADSWLGQGEVRETDNVLRSLSRIFRISLRGMWATFRSIFQGEKPASGSAALSVARNAILFFLAAAVALGGGNIHSQAQGSSVSAPSPPADANAPVPPGDYHDHFTIADTGASQIELHSIDTVNNVYFTLPETHVIGAAKIHIYYSFSPSLLPQLSHLKLIMNGTLFATIQPTPGQNGGSDSRDAEAEFAIPPDLLVHNNTLTIEFIGHYTMVCEDPANTTLWARVHRGTYIDIRGRLLQLANDLKQLPMPFVDPAVIQPLSVPVVFLAEPSYKAVEAAGIVTSYLGMISENRPVRFPVHIGTIPAGNAVVIAESPAGLPAAFNLSGVNAPTVAMRDNPGDPFGKLLILTGGNPDDLVKAAQAIALRSEMLDGPQAQIQDVVLPNRQAPDAAPRWARTDQTIALWDYATAEQLQGDGATPLNVYFRIPPDIYPDTKGPNTTLHVVYRYNSIPIGPISSLQMRVNNAFLGSIPLIPGQETSRRMQTDVSVPIVNLRPFSNSLSFDFTFQLLKKAGCQDTTPISMQGAIMRDSYLDLRGFPHWAPMPNLEIFANAGFPFTRVADLGETTVVLPPTPTEQEIETFVTLMGHFGRQTGFPGLRVTVAGPDAVHDGANTDFLIIGSGDDQPGFDQLGTHLPVSLGSGQIQVRDTEGFFVDLLHHAWWKLDNNQHTDSGMLTAAGTPDAIIEGIRSPYEPGGSRSIVAIHLKDGGAFQPFMDTFIAVQQSSDISGSVAVFHGGRFESFRIGSEVYHVGVLPWWTYLMLWFTERPWMAALVVVTLSVMVAFWVRLWLRVRARARLTMVEN